MDRLGGLVVSVVSVAGTALGRAKHLLDQRRLVVMVMNVGDELVDVQFGERPHRVGGVHDRLQRVIGWHRLGDNRKQVVHLLGRGVGKSGVFECLVGVIDKRTEIGRFAEQASREIEDRHGGLPAGLRRAHGFAGRFGGAGRQLDRVIGHLFEDVELPLELADPGVALVLLELRGRDGGL